MIKPNSFELKSKDSVVVTNGPDVEINKIKLLGPGEYEVGGIEVFGFNQAVYILNIDGVLVGYLANVTEPIDEKEIEEFGSIDILITPAGLDSSFDMKKITELTKSLDPNVVVSANNENSAKFCEAFGKCEEPVEIYKTTKQQLMSMEGLTAIQLKG